MSIISRNPLKKLFEWMLSWGESKYALIALNIFSFIEASFFPIPPDILLISLTMGAQDKWKKFATWCTFSSVLGGIAGYLIGYLFFNTLGTYILSNVLHITLIEVNGKMDIALPTYIASIFSQNNGEYFLFQAYEDYSAWIVFVFGLTPLPFKLITLTSGMAHSNITIFVIASILSRGTRFFAVAYTVKVFGNKAIELINKYFNLLCFAFVFILIIFYLVFKYFT